ncbi:hypothetical protein FRX31_007526 [Thalictrum thalictroides]|uniref:Uncharacterized protein n=1 Tax=Thalictrum thalictroides TaxID=46969 RepID=A0A7J6X1F8_THATH|nr:hypothetical protein FRX31_007526 [Thalictrum thalictroides]
MRNQLSLTEEDDNESSVFCWWRLAKEIKDNGHHLSIDLSKLSELTPRLKVLREMERLALVANEGMDDLRHKLLSYRSGDFCLPTGGIKKEEMNIPPITTILLVGFTGSGKSSLVNLMYSVLGRSGLIPFAQTSSKLKGFLYFDLFYFLFLISDHGVCSVSIQRSLQTIRQCLWKNITF